MLLKLGILIVLVLASFIFLGIKISDKIKQQEIKMLFFSLYGMTIFTIFNLVISVYFFTAMRHKRGPIGPKGKKGEMGDKGIDSKCEQLSCLRKTLQNIIVNYLETKTPILSLDGTHRTMICSMTKQLEIDNLKELFSDNIITEIENELDKIKTDNPTTDIFKTHLVEVAKILKTDIENADIKATFCN